MTTLGLAVLRWNFTRIKWPLIISGAVGLLAAFTLMSVGPQAANEFKQRNCDQVYSRTRFPNNICRTYDMPMESL
jgi:hypothetical protein